MEKYLIGFGDSYDEDGERFVTSGKRYKIEDETESGYIVTDDTNSENHLAKSKSSESYYGRWFTLEDDKRKLANENEEFENVYKEYKKSVKAFSGGLVKTNKAEFIKLYSFYSTITEPTIMKFWDAYLGKK